MRNAFIRLMKATCRAGKFNSPKIGFILLQKYFLPFAYVVNIRDD